MRPVLEWLEHRLAPAANVLTYHNDAASTGQNLAETVLTPANVNASSFGKVFTAPADGYVYAQPLVMTGLTVSGQGTHDVVFVATENDSLYALDAATGSQLWKDSFLQSGLPGASSFTPVPNADVGTSDVVPQIGITGTPVIDPATDTLYLVAKTKETVNGVAHYVQRLHAIDVTSGAEKFGGPALLGDTTYNGTTYTNNTTIWVNGTGDGTDGHGHVYFNALRQFQRGALTLDGGTLYIAWASHGDNGPYHGWVAAYDPGTLQLKGVFNTTPNAGLGGIWEAGGKLSADGQGDIFFETGNGGFDSTLNANGFPALGDYGDSVIKLTADPVHNSPTNQNVNGWGLQVVDYFTPYNQAALDAADQDLGSGADLLLPDAVGDAAHPRLLVASGKSGTIYLLDRDKLGKFSPDQATELTRVVQELPNALNGSLDTAAYYGNQLYYVQGYGGVAQSWGIPNGSAALSTSPASVSADSYAFAGSTPSVSANGGTNGIVWDIDRGTNELRAYSAAGYNVELWTSDQAAGNRDLLGSAVKFTVPTVANGFVYVGTTNALVAYGLVQPPTQPPAAPTNLSAGGVSGSQIDLTWTDNDTAPNTADGYYVEQSPDGSTGWTRVGTAAAGTRAFAVGNLTPGTTYYFRVQAYDVVGTSAYSSVAAGATLTAGAGLNFAGGFAGAAGVLTFNGATVTSANRLRLTDGGTSEARSAFSSSPLAVTAFTTQFTFQLTNANADGFTFTIQGDGPTALGGTGGGLGYGPDPNSGGASIAKSVAVKFDLYDNAGEGPDSTGLFVNGVSPTTPATDLSGAIDLHSGDVLSVSMSYDGTTLQVTITDTSTGRSATQSYSANIPALVGANSAYVGFTAGTGGLSAVQEILTWTYTPANAGPPAVPGNLKATLTTANNAPAATLTWDDAPGETGFKIERKLGASGSYSQVATVGAGVLTWTDTGLATQSQYYYRIRATNSFGDSAYSNEASVTTPALPPTPTGGHATFVSATQDSIAWTDNAGSSALGYRVYRSSDATPMVLIATLPAGSTSYSDSGLTPGSRYDYHVQAYNDSGYSDFAGATLYTLTPAPTGLTATASGGQVTLSWSAPPTGTTSAPPTPVPLTYNVYRATTPGGEGTAPYATGLTTTSFTDTVVTAGTTYYYTVTALVPNVSPLAQGSAQSLEASTAPGINFSSGFAGATGLTLNGAAAISGSRLRLTDGGASEAASAFASTPVGVAAFTTQFSFQLTSASADGFTFTIQGDGPKALGGTGGGLGYGPDPNSGGASIAKSVAVKFDLYDNAGEGPDSTGLFVNGATPTTGGVAPSTGSTNLTGVIDLHSGDPIAASLTYDGATLTVTLTDTVTNTTATQTYLVNITNAVGGTTAWVGFTAGTGGLSAVQDVLSWQFTPSSPTSPPPTINYSGGFSGATGLTLNGATAISGTHLRLTNGGAAEAASAFASTAVGIGKFTTQFSFQLTSASADGFTFTIQGDGPTALGGTGGGLGYGPDPNSGGASIAKSVAVKFDLYDNAGEGGDSTGLFLDGITPTTGGVAPSTGSTDLSTSGLDLHSGDLFKAAMGYDGSTLTVALTDTVTGKSATQTYKVNIASAVGSTQAWVGFTAGTGGLTATQDVLSWQFTTTG